MNENNSTIEIDLRRIMAVLWRHVWVMLLVGVLLAAAAFSYAWFFVTPTYAASTQLYVNNTYGENTVGFSSSQLTAAQDLADTYMVILESRSVLEDVREQTGLDYSYKQLKSMISASAVNETEVFQINVISTNYKHAAIIANSLAEVLPAKISAVVDGSSVRVVDYAVENPNPVGPNYQRYGLLGALVGIILTAAVIVVIDVTDTSITSEEYLTHKYSKIPLLVVIPNTDNSKSGSYYRGYYESADKRTLPNQKGGKK